MISHTALQQYKVELEIAQFGYLLQNDTRNGLEDCGPTSATNGLVFLQNTYPEIYGDKLVGSTYSQWEAAANKLQNNMRTGPDGTASNTYTFGLENYFDVLVPDTTALKGQALVGNGWPEGMYQAEYFENCNPTAEFLYTALLQRSAVGIGVLGETGHFLTVVGINWSEQDKQGTISLLDPLDPGNLSTVVDPKQAIAKIGKLDEQNGMLRLTYDLRYKDQGQIETKHHYECSITFAIAVHPVSDS